MNRESLQRAESLTSHAAAVLCFTNSAHCLHSRRMEHDRLFKELLRTFFTEFISAFVPNVEEFLDPSSIEFLDKEVFTDLTAGQRHEVDLLAKVRFKGKETFFLIHVENQASAQEDFAGRMFRYFARLHEKFALPVYPIALLSYESPRRAEPSRYEISFPGLKVLSFEFHAIQLNQLNWRDYLRSANPVAAALMTKMKIEPRDRPRVVLECLRMIATLKLDPARQSFISSFMYAYLQLSAEELAVYNREIESISPEDREAIMKVVNPWEEQGIRTGEQRGEERGVRVGEERGTRAVLVRQLTRKFGQLPTDVHEKIDSLSQDKLGQLADAVLEFSALEDVQSWLGHNR